MNYIQTLRDNIKNTREALDKLERIVDFLDSVSEKVERRYHGGNSSAIELMVSEETFDMIPGIVSYEYRKVPAHSSWLHPIYFINKEHERFLNK